MKIFSLLIALFFCTLTYAQNSNTQPLAFDTIYTKPEKFASYPGGDEGWKEYLKKNLKYPKKAWWDEIETEITIKVIVDKEGNIQEAKHLTIAGEYGFEKEAVRLVTKSGKWIPAIHRGKPVACEGTLVIPFKLK